MVVAVRSGSPRRLLPSSDRTRFEQAVIPDEKPSVHGQRPPGSITLTIRRRALKPIRPAVLLARTAHDRHRGTMGPTRTGHLGSRLALCAGSTKWGTWESADGPTSYRTAASPDRRGLGWVELIVQVATQSDRGSPARLVVPAVGGTLTSASPGAERIGPAGRGRTVDERRPAAGRGQARVVVEGSPGWADRIGRSRPGARGPDPAGRPMFGPSRNKL